MASQRQRTTIDGATGLQVGRQHQQHQTLRLQPDQETGTRVSSEEYHHGGKGLPFWRRNLDRLHATTATTCTCTSKDSASRGWRSTRTIVCVSITSILALILLSLLFMHLFVHGSGQGHFRRQRYLIETFGLPEHTFGSSSWKANDGVAGNHSAGSGSDGGGGVRSGGAVSRFLSVLISLFHKPTSFELYASDTKVTWSVDPHDDARWIEVMSTAPLLSLMPRHFGHEAEGLAMAMFDTTPRYRAVFKQKGERHEIGAFHVDRLLEFNRTPVAVKRAFTVESGRVVGCQRECEWMDMGGHNDRDVTDGRVSGVVLQYVDGVEKMKAQRWDACASMHFDFEGSGTVVTVDGRGDDDILHVLRDSNKSGDLNGPSVVARRKTRTAAKVPRWKYGIQSYHESVPAVSCTLPRTLDIADMAIFDAIISNRDRWASHHRISNLHTTQGDGSGVGGGRFMFLDHHLAFGEHPLVLPDAAFEMCRFWRTTYASLRRFCTRGSRGKDLMCNFSGPLRERFVWHSLPRDFLSDGEMKVLDRAVAKVTAHIDECLTRHGEERVLFDPAYI